MSALACLLCGLFVDAGMSLHQAHAVPAPISIDSTTGTRWTIQPTPLYDTPIVRNPYAAVSVGYQVTVSPHVAFTLQLRHESSLATGRDHGTNSLQLALRWTPWSKQ